MKLSYRGVSYEYTPTLEMTEGEIVGRHRHAHQRGQTSAAYQQAPLMYRGVRYTPTEVAQANRAAAKLATNTPLMYRGVAYLANATSSVSNTITPEKVVIPDRMPVLQELGRIHKSNLRQNLERRLKAAQAQGNESLVALLELESRQLAL